MLNFKKGSIFSRSAGNEDAYEEYEQEDQGGVLAVWGSPGSGKTTVAARIAKHLAGKRKNTILLLCDMSAPMLPCICPPRDLENKGSLGSVLAAAHVSDSLIKNNLTTHKRLDYGVFIDFVRCLSGAWSLFYRGRFVQAASSCYTKGAAFCRPPGKKAGSHHGCTAHGLGCQTGPSYPHG